MIKQRYRLLYNILLPLMLVSLLLGESCSESPDAWEFKPPHLGRPKFRTTGSYSGTIEAQVALPSHIAPSDQNCKFGFYFYPDSNSPSSSQSIVAALQGDRISANMENLSIGVTYKCIPFVKEGEFEALGEESSLRLENPFEDETFREYIFNHYDTDGDGGISANEAESVKYIDVQNLGIESLKGVELFPFLQQLNCQNNKIKELDLSSNPYLTELNAEINRLEELDLRNNRELRTINVWENCLTKIDLTGLDLVGTFWCWNNRLNEIDISSMRELINFGCAQNPIKELDLSNNRNLINFAPNHTLVETLDLSHCPNLQSIEIQGIHTIRELDVSCCPKLRFLRSEDCQNLKFIYISKGQKIAEVIKDEHTQFIEK